MADITVCEICRGETGAHNHIRIKMREIGYDGVGTTWTRRWLDYHPSCWYDVTLAAQKAQREDKRGR